MSDAETRPGYAWGGPSVRGCIRCQPEDFQVSERLGHEPDGAGEHLWLWVTKRERNTVDVAADLARAAGVPLGRVGFAGLKDRNALTSQYFSVQLPGQTMPDWRDWSIDGVEIESATWSSRKIRRGRLRGNRFELIVRELDGDRDALEACLAAVRDQGVPNGFGEQRFGNNNIARALSLFRGEMRRKPSKTKRGFYLSAARSLVFNHVLAERIRRADWNHLIDGELAVLDGSHSFFQADASDPEQIRRCSEMDIHPSGPLPGQGDSPATGEAAEIENRMFFSHRELIEGLAKFGMKQERRSLRMRVDELAWSFPDDRSLKLTFSLGKGSYATSVLRELVAYEEGYPANPGQ